MGTLVEDIGCRKGADDRIEGFVGKGQVLRGPLYAGDCLRPFAELLPSDALHRGGRFDTDDAALPSLQDRQQLSRTKPDFEDSRSREQMAGTPGAKRPTAPD